ncbi:hypothetical protein Ade02nite_21240 [Paractinoplanes deccanensis]|uniref:Uncharacterized protein n=2 Tax=Paractinoplanes deccanensis TaxID=113561 RepID=A0ABQ3Y0G7_9ACTN|nr:hypothetical protein Ade02nite_21240 [Actinoplanes deccanensis]
MTEQPAIVLVRGVVYKLLNRSNLPISKPKFKYYRMSVPPDAMPSVRSKWPAAYAVNRLPAHEVIDEAKAREVVDAAMNRWRSVFKANQAAAKS